MLGDQKILQGATMYFSKTALRGVGGATACFLLLIALAAAAPPQPVRDRQEQPPQLERFEFSEPHMGVTFKLLFYAPDSETANRAAQAAFKRIAGLDRALSDYDPDSELNELSLTAGQGRNVPVSDDLWRVLTGAKGVSQQSHGAFDVTVGPIVRLWRRARRQQKLPSPERLEQALKAVGHVLLRMDAEAKTVQLTQPAMQLDLGGIAKGYAADEALQVLETHGIDRALVDASGDLAFGAPPPGREGWRIGIAPLAADAPPSRFLLLADQAVATSGDAWQFIELDGRRYSHIVDPRTGIGLTTRSSVTVLAPCGMRADALASALSVLGPERGLALADRLDRVAALFVVQEDDRTVAYSSRRMKQLIGEL